MNNDLFFIEQLSPLYEDVQQSGIFPDSKFFPDCVPTIEPATILEAYKNEKSLPGFNLKEFVNQYFTYPEEAVSSYESTDKPLSEHLAALWPVLRRQPSEADAGPSTLIPLPYPYIVPGGRFREVYYWDSYFTMLGLQVSGQHELIRHMVGNFAHLIDTAGFIPNGNRTYYLSRSQPPFFALMVDLLQQMTQSGGADILLQYRHQLAAEYAFWMSGEQHLDADKTEHRRVVQLPDGSILNRYWDDRPEPRPEAWAEDVHVAQQSNQPPEIVYRHIRAAAESGWDFSSRWFADGQNMHSIRTTELVPVDLNCLLYFLEKTLVDVYRQLPDRTPVEVMKTRARQRKNAIQQHCWNPKTGFYFDYDIAHEKTSDCWTLAGIFPLFFNIATPEQAAHVAQHIEAKFLQAGGVVTTLTQTGQQWDAPNGWAPLQWMTLKGLQQYGHHTLANQLRDRWMRLNEKTYAATGKMMEKYNVMDTDVHAGGGEYPNQDGFGWTNGVCLEMGGEDGFE